MQIIKDIIGKVSFLIGIFCMIFISVILAHPRMSMSPFFAVVIFLIHIVCMIGAGSIHWSDDKNKQIFMKIRIFCMVLFYAILLWQVVLGNTVIDRNQNMKDINFIPFKMVVEYIRKYQEGDISIYLVVLNLLGNIVLLAPVGFYLGICTKKRRWLFSLVIGGFCSLVIEILQMLLGRGRFDVDDIILNVVGVGVMYGFAKLSIIRKIMTKFEIRY